jgi:predicted dehydrogenase
MSKKVNFGIIGTGTMAIESHIPAIKDTSSAELVELYAEEIKKEQTD